MLIVIFTLFVLFGWEESVSLKLCPPLSSPPHGFVKCIRKNETVSCNSEVLAGSIAEYSCQEFYKISEEMLVECWPNGSWSSAAPKCVPECGKRSSSVSLIVNGKIASKGSFPWHVAIYNSIDGIFEYWCGGSLISETAVITAAHCTWKIPPEKLLLVLGKFHREYNFSETNVQEIKVKKIEILDSYQDITGNYNGDIAVVLLERAVVLGHYSSPVCIDWDQQLVDKHLEEGSFGVVLGWGLTENDTLSDSLRSARIPVVSDAKCIADQERDFKKFITYTSFCAGFGNGTGVCNGDSGGGLTFFDEISGRWYLHGLVSVSPRRKGTFYCDTNFYTVFTKVSLFSKWVKEVEKLEEEIPTPTQGSLAKEEKFKDFLAFVRKYGGKGSKSEGTKIVYPHSKKMLELARVF